MDVEPVTTQSKEKKPIILLVDDNKPTLELLHEYFSIANEKGHLECGIISAANGQEAIDLIDVSQPDIVICDIIMPVKNGFDVLEHFNNWSRQQNPYCFFCFFSNSDDEKSRAFNSGVDGFLAKKTVDYFPFTLQIKSWLKLVAFERKYGA
jgi:CheY-like chemotaxis protein